MGKKPPARQHGRRGTPHRWTSEEASQAGHKGGLQKAANDRARQEQVAAARDTTPEDPYNQYPDEGDEAADVKDFSDG